ncbi:unnamed protein product [Hermetia illucens]|uniref:BRCT domain-containing protein n=1 Tax=Hermetia illucens TaxID=343691 RepID=A0A7R8Z513_HERIL|nr:unnamed protein product [Hermetia illucens]
MKEIRLVLVLVDTEIVTHIGSLFAISKPPFDVSLCSKKKYFEIPEKFNERVLNSQLEGTETAVESKPIKEERSRSKSRENTPRKSERPKKPTPKKETPKKQTPKKETPKKQTPKKESPKKQTPKKESPTVSPKKEEETHRRGIKKTPLSDLGLNQTSEDEPHTSPKRKASKKADLNSSVPSDEERHERKQLAAILYQKYKNRQSVINPGCKEVPKGQPNCLAGLSFLVTDILESLEREECNSLIKDLGGKVSSTVGKRLDYLVVGEEAGPKKLATAQDLGIKVIRSINRKMIKSNLQVVIPSTKSPWKQNKQTFPNCITTSVPIKFHSYLRYHYGNEQKSAKILRNL